MQVQDNDEERPIAFASRTLSPAERNYSITEKEMLGALWVMEYYEYYLYGREFVVRSDHKALEAFNTEGYLESARINRWMDRIARFSFTVEYRKGESIPHVDALSRQGDIRAEVPAVNEIAGQKDKCRKLLYCSLNRWNAWVKLHIFLKCFYPFLSTTISRRKSGTFMVS
ncbi:hypothetical protein PAPHI01_2675 [Pancytospora philotis]|nr:hypothetical protein PAPHI01_2675 [Pancytospora philotis]